MISLRVMKLNIRRTTCSLKLVPLGKWDQGCGKSVVWETILFHFYPSVLFESALLFLCLFVYSMYVYVYVYGSSLVTN